MKRYYIYAAVLMFILLLVAGIMVTLRREPAIPQAVATQTYYMSPLGNDSANGLTPGTAWATFSKAFSVVKPGEEIVLLDGIYYQAIEPNTRGLPGQPITIRAQNDGKAMIAGEGLRTPVNLWGYRNAGWFVFEGLVFTNGTLQSSPVGNGAVLQVETDNNVFRRISAYNANPDENSNVFNLTGGGNLIEDCIVAGTGRKLLSVYGSGGLGNTVRRCFGLVTDWQGRNRGNEYPWTDGFQFYNSNYNIFENVIVYGPGTLWNLSFQANTTTASASYNKILGSISIGAGMEYDLQSVKYFGCPTKPEPCSGADRPQPTTLTMIRDFDWPAQRVGIDMHGSGALVDNLFQDVLAYRSAGVGFATSGSVGSNAQGNVIRRMTLVQNGIDNKGPHDGGVGADTIVEYLSRFTVYDSRIDVLRNKAKVTQAPLTGEGARLRYRYVDGVLTNQELWPWPMEQRGLDELGISITNLIVPILINTDTYK